MPPDPKLQHINRHPRLRILLPGRDVVTGHLIERLQLADGTWLYRCRIVLWAHVGSIPSGPAVGVIDIYAPAQAACQPIPGQSYAEVPTWRYRAAVAEQDTAP